MAALTRRPSRRDQSAASAQSSSATYAWNVRVPEAKPYAASVRDELVELAARLASEVDEGQTPLDEAERRLGCRAFELLLPADDVLDSGGAAGRAAPTADDADLAAVLRHIAATLGDPDNWKPAPEYHSTALAAIDAIWSINVRYAGVVNVIARYSAARVEQGGDPQADTPADLLAFIEGCGSADSFAAAVKNRQRTSSTGGILKAEAAEQAAALLIAHDVDTPRALRSLDTDARQRLEEEWRAIRGQRYGTSWDYFLMLNGISGVKTDRQICRFVAEALGVREADVSPSRARALVVAASEQLGIGARVLDFAIWEYMSSR